MWAGLRAKKWAEPCSRKVRAAFTEKYDCGCGKTLILFCIFFFLPHSLSFFSRTIFPGCLQRCMQMNVLKRSRRFPFSLDFSYYSSIFPFLLTLSRFQILSLYSNFSLCFSASLTLSPFAAWHTPTQETKSNNTTE